MFSCLTVSAAPYVVHATHFLLPALWEWSLTAHWICDVDTIKCCFAACVLTPALWLCRYAELKREIAAEELAQCTFSPKINQSSKRLAQSARRPKTARGSPSVTPSPPKQSLQSANKARFAAGSCKCTLIYCLGKLG